MHRNIKWYLVCPVYELERILNMKEATNQSQSSASRAVASIFGSAETTLNRLIDPVNRVSVYVSSGLSLVMAAAIIIDLVARFLFDISFMGMIELETFLLVVLCFFSLAYTLREEAHVSVDILTNKFSRGTQLFLNLIFSVLALLLFVIMAWQAWLRAVESFTQYEVANVSQIPYYPFVFVVVFGCIATALVCLSNLLRAVKDNFIFQERPIASVLLAFIASTSILAFPFLLKQSEVEMGSITVSLVFIALMILLLILGFPVAFSMALVGVMGIWYLTEFQLSIDIVKMVTYDAVAHYYYCVIPFFILMGFLSLEAGIGTRLYNVGAKWFGQLPGGLAIGTIIGCGGFAAICGDSMATAATMGSVSVPEMNKFNYKASLSNGSVAAGGTLGILIPPSVGFIAYGIVTEQAVGKLFMAGIIPGIILMVCFALMIYSRALLDPELGPRAPKSTLLEKITSIKDIWQVMILFGGVIGGIFSGVITPTEAGAVGAVGALVIAMFSGVFSKEGFYRALLISTKMSGMIFAILIGVGLLGYFVTLTDLPMQLAENLKSIDVSKYVLLTLILMLYLFLGMLMNIIPMIMLTLPILFPTVMALGFDPIWFGVIMVIIMEMGQITPPVGINVFVIHGISGNVPMVEIYKGIVPFVLVQIAVIVLLTLFPEIVMLLPNSMDVLAPIN